MTRRGTPCRNPVAEGRRCRLHGGFTTGAPGGATGFAGSEVSSPPPADPLARLKALEDAALGRALGALDTKEGEGSGRSDASFNRNARLAALIARLRLALSRAPEAAAGGGTEGGEEKTTEVTIYRLPDNGR